MTQPEVLQLLRDLEWSGNDDSGSVCPECRMDAFSGHETNCRLREAIEALEGEMESESVL